MKSVKLIARLIVLFLIIQASSSRKDQSQDYDIAIFYWPDYHYEPRLKSIFSEKRGKFGIIYHAKHKETGHQRPKVPLWGREDDPKVMSKKIDAAYSNETNVFLFDWYYNNEGHFLQNGRIVQAYTLMSCFEGLCELCQTTGKPIIYFNATIKCANTCLNKSSHSV